MIETVLGAIEAEDLGITSMHEHVMADSSRLQRPGMHPAPDEDRVTMSVLGYLLSSAMGATSVHDSSPDELEYLL
jgi:phosphotriesterase-related protein